MMYYIESSNTDPYRNLALEQVIFDRLDPDMDHFMLWQNKNAIIVGKHQNTSEEINASFVKEHGINVARRLSGGGAVYHDLGNINFTFIRSSGNERGLDFSFFCEPVKEVLRTFGVPVELSGRNDMTVEGMKFSGNAQYIKGGRVMHHGTILYDSDLSMLSKALKPGTDKIESRGIKSVRGRVTNIRPYMKEDMSVADFREALRDRLAGAFDLRKISLEPEHNAAVDELRDSLYARWAWNYGNSPPHNVRKARRFEGCGKIEVFLDIGQEGIIKNIAFYGDFFSSRDPAELCGMLTSCHLEYSELKAALAGTDVSRYFNALDGEAFLELLLE